MKKRALWIAGILLLVLCVGGMLLFRPMPIVSSPYTLPTAQDGSYVESDVAIGSVYSEGIEITEEIDLAAVAELLSRYECRRTLGNPFPMPVNEMRWEINLVQHFKPMHIVLGKTSVRYESADGAIYEILEPETLIQALQQLLK